MMKESTIDEDDESLDTSTIGPLCWATFGFQDIKNEVEGIADDIVESFRQVLLSCFLGPDDIDGVADTIREGRDEIVGMELERRWETIFPTDIVVAKR